MIITLTTDFGNRDSFVGAMKGVILNVRPADTDRRPGSWNSCGDVRGAFALMTAAPYFPTGAIHVVVVDPGVGGARKAVAIRTGRSVFLGPDNGVLSWALREEAPSEVRCGKSGSPSSTHERHLSWRDLFCSRRPHGWRSAGTSLIWDPSSASFNIWNGQRPRLSPKVGRQKLST
jgi:S-adenosylmethionine hydrolase